MNFSSQGPKTIIITGTAGSIGSVLAKSFRGDGITVIGIDRKVNSSVDEYYFHFDFNENTAVEQTIWTITQEHEEIDGLINCAGISLSSNDPYNLRLL
jgi:NADP-dependent 3-hydroxy acid dehydrogenase YdfG